MITLSGVWHFLFSVTFLWCDFYNEIRACALLIAITLLFLLRKFSYVRLEFLREFCDAW